MCVCVTNRDGSRSYGTTLFYFEPLSSCLCTSLPIEINGENQLNAGGKQLFVPKALCLLSHQPMFSAFAIFLRCVILFCFTNRELFRNSVTVTEDAIGDDMGHTRRSSFNSKLRKGSTCNVIDDDLIVDCPSNGDCFP